MARPTGPKSPQAQVYSKKVESPIFTPGDAKILSAKKAQLEARRQELIGGLPHLYGQKWYGWARSFLNSKNKMCLLCAANQVSKSSTQIRKYVHWATSPKLWPELWGHRPRQFWYLYPTRDVATDEFELKWEPEWMPRGRFKDDPQYGWEAIYDGKHISAIQFKSGVRLMFKTYAQSATNLQTGSCDVIACDEELNEHLLPELQARLIGTNGYFSMVFTATLNQQLWWQAMEGKGDTEKFPQAHKIQVSLWDSQYYDDGTPSKWTDERIREVEASCKSETEVQRRVYGKFVAEEGRKYPHFTPTRHMIKPRPIPFDWLHYGAIDKGSGRKTSKNNHYSAIAFIAVNPEGTLGYVYDGWRGDGVEATCQDLLDLFKQMRGRRQFTLQIFPHDAKDFGIIAGRQGEPFIPANKSHSQGEDTLNTLFKADMLFVFDTPELQKFATEFMTLMKSTEKDRARDDGVDATRYTAIAIPWDWNHAAKVIADAERNLHEEAEGHSPAGELVSRPLTDQEALQEEVRRRRGESARPSAAVNSAQDFEDECAEWNELYGS